ncbi:hypothetical protein KA005_46225, partial [bacterium]|nr:hypothetical protein [bacterium]
LRFIITCLVPIVAVLMFTIGGVLFILSQFDIVSVDIFSKAKGTVTAVVVGLVIIFVSWVFLNVFLSTIGIAEWTGLGSWWRITCGPPIYCEECSDCSSGDYCEEARGICLALPACAECNTAYGFNPQEYNEDQRGDCSDCSTCSGSAVGPGSCTPVADNTQHGDCDDLCEACQSGVCGDALSGTDPGDYCFLDPRYRNGGDTYSCQKREKDGNCDGSGSCNTTYGAWYDINEGENCSGDYECDGDTYLSPFTCVSGTCSGAPADIGCCACSYCSPGQYCASNHLCTDLPVCKVCNVGFDYSNAANGTSCGTCKACVSGDCIDQTTDWGAGLYLCIGINKKCETGSCIERECSQGSDCPDGEYCNNSYQCVSLPVCKERNNSGLGYNDAPDTNWGTGSYNCTANNQRCVSGVCRKCDTVANGGLGGYFYAANCFDGDNCPTLGPGGKVCWYQAGNGESCTNACSGHGAVCLSGTWNDSGSCSVCITLINRHYPSFNPGCSAVLDPWGSGIPPKGDAPRYLDEGWLGEWCYKRATMIVPEQGCSNALSNYYRQCVCSY